MSARTWSYGVPPDVTVAVRANRGPVLLSRILGPEDPLVSAPSVLLDLAPAKMASGGSKSPGDRKTVRGVYKAVPWSCAVGRGQDGGLSLGFTSPVMREYLALHIALLPALRLLLLQRDVALVLGAALELDGRTVVLAGRTGSGKTTLLTGALERGARFIGDEYIGVSDQGAASPIVRSLALRQATLRLAPAAAARLSAGRRIALRLAGLVAGATAGRFDPLSHVPPSGLGMPAVPASRGKIERLYWLEVDPALAQAKTVPMPASDAVEELALRLAGHQAAYRDIGPVLDTAAGCGESGPRWRAVLARGLEGATCVRLSFPPQAAEEALHYILQDAS